MWIQRFAQKGVVINGDKILVIRYGSGKYQNAKLAGKFAVPGGKVEMGQTVDESILVEIMEETGVTCLPGLPVYCWNWEYKKDQDVVQINAVMRVCKYVRGKLIQRREDKESTIVEVRWVGIDELRKLDWVFDEKPGVDLFLEKKDFYLASFLT